MTSPSRTDNQPAHEHKPVLDKFIQRLIGAIGRSPLLKSHASKTGRLLDCFRFEQVNPWLSNEILETVVDRTDPVAVQLDLRALRERSQSDEGNSLFIEVEADEEQMDKKIAEEHLRLHRTLEKMSRAAELVKRETGRHALWLGYPLLYANSGESDILAPVFLWPIFVEIDYRHQGRVLIGRAQEQKVGLPPQFNRAMAAWLQRQCEVQLADFSNAELSEIDLEAVKKELQEIGAQFHPGLSPVDCEKLLEPIPPSKSLDPRKGPHFHHSAVMGYFRWQNEAILADLESLRKRDAIEGVAEGFTSGVELPIASIVPTPPEEDRYLVCDADFSQERVVWQARAQPGLVVHGPPGTGKSQTIVNIIADALAHGRTVLMVCQKQAATNVVLQRLKEVGLDHLCLNVHDAAADRQYVFKTIRDQVDRLKNTSPTKYESRGQISRQITEKEAVLDDHARALHEMHPRIGLSYKQMKAREGRLSSKFPSARELVLLRPALEKLTSQQVLDILPTVQAAGQSFHQADALGNPWRERLSTVMATPAMRVDVTNALKELLVLDSVHMRHVQTHGVCTSLPISLADFAIVAPELVNRLQQLNKSESLFKITCAWTTTLRKSNNADLQHHKERCEAAVKSADKVANTTLDPQWSSVLDTRTSHELTKLLRQAQTAVADSPWWNFPRRMWRWRARRAIEVISHTFPGDDSGSASVSLLAHLEARHARKTLDEINEEIVPTFQHEADEKDQVDLAMRARDAFELASWFEKTQREHEWCRPVVENALQSNDRLHFTLNDIERSLLRVHLVDKLSGALDRMKDFLNLKALEGPTANIQSGKSICAWIESVDQGLDKLQSLIALDAERQHRKSPMCEILDLLEAYEVRLANGEKLPAPSEQLDAERHGQWWATLLEYAAVMMWVRECVSQRPVLHQTPETLEKTRQELGHLLEKKRSLEAQAILSLWRERQRQYAHHPWPKELQLRAGKEKAPRLREAVARTLPRGLLTMRPCWLVNPEAAAQIFPLQSGLFDVVIFDEASQCPIEQAVPAVYRGKSLIVSGDEKQLPPTDFFLAGTRGGSADDENLEDESATDQSVQTQQQEDRRFGAQFLLQVEDLLEAAIGNLPAKWLSVHYRSEHPDLIDFSNYAFYKGELEYPPSRLSSQGDYRAIVYHDIGGHYSNRTNRQEAIKVVQLLKDFWFREGRSPTIGVVTFNQPQRELIEDLIEEECHGNEAFEARCAQERGRREDNQDVGLFVKNLENVQGDERDVMIFSTTFGRDSSGQFFRRFGPVGAKGGERRLNVAVTRAKRQIIVCGSMPIEDLSDALRMGSAPGTGINPTGYLQLYLAYAQAVSAGNREKKHQILDCLKRQAAPNPIGKEPESPLEEEVRHELEKLEYNVRSQIGESGFRIDLAVLHPDPTRGYLLGIECDGATYHSDRSARIRDVWREKILRKRGWRIHRVWSTSWWYQRAKEIEKLEIALAEAMSQFMVDDLSVVIPQADERPIVDVNPNGPMADAHPPNSELASASTAPKDRIETPDIDGLLSILDKLMFPYAGLEAPRATRLTRRERWRSVLASCDATPEAMYDALAKIESDVRRDRRVYLAAIRTWSTQTQH